MLIFKLFLLSLVSLVTTDLRVLFFTMDSCPPCKQTEPGIDQLRNEGVAVSKIDVRQNREYANQCQVSQTPTVMIVDGNRVLARHTGAMSPADLRQMLADSTTPTPAVKSRPVSTTPPIASPQSELTPEQRAHQATVRFRVEDAQGTSFATGTIIHRQNQEALVLTCGHVFRDSQGQGKINADLGFAFGEPTTVIGKLIYYNSDEHDIALVAIPCLRQIEPIPVAPESLAVQTGDTVFSLGCDRGNQPSVRQSVLKAVTTYSGVAKYDIVGRPVDGRSGGGLFSAGGQLIGVCNAAAVEVDEGIYTGLQSVYWQFAKTNLTHLFKRNAASSQLTFEPAPQVAQNRQQATPRSQPSSPGRLAHPSVRPPQTPAANVVARNDELSPPVATAIYRGDGVPVNSAVYRGNEIPLRNAGRESDGSGQPTGDYEMIVIFRSKTDPYASETITIPNPDSETLAWLRDSGQQNNRSQAKEPGMVDRMARLPDLPNPSNRSSQPQMRAQSPR